MRTTQDVCLSYVGSLCKVPRLEITLAKRKHRHANLCTIHASELSHCGPRSGVTKECDQILETKVQQKLLSYIYVDVRKLIVIESTFRNLRSVQEPSTTARDSFLPTAVLYQVVIHDAERFDTKKMRVDTHERPCRA